VRQSLGHSLSKSGSSQSELSKREREVLQLIAEGKSTKKIAAMLHVSVKTVETHRKQIMDKLDIHSVAELTKYAVREGVSFL
jgi:DNA-binding NarL/FixJ family response regulator